MNFKNSQVNVAIQVLPLTKAEHVYPIVDEAIKIIEQSGLKYRVCPFETVIEGSYSEVMGVVEKVQAACYNAGAENLICNLKIQSSKVKEVRIEDKVEKYDIKKGC
ncbi:MTH1187 family thiamine-binding protein [Carboxylicivirga sp. N1Y90]|uniref:MTH1187 family thiamine-binding protein n=1 Tax=Carboxylicivirga fragile TaxID=3417571 RepID=UPI003D33F283|nr:MTH1187 family thiamine-binding protein [Marinilabiliaceae bacterium N1Y90]